MNTPEYEYKQISTKSLVVDPMYQRELNSVRVAKIVSDFEPRLVNAIKVSCRDGRYYVFDGQHTMAALKAKHDNRDCMVECKVFYGLTWFDEAKLFLLQTGHSAGVEMNAKFKTLFTMGDPDVVKMVRLAENCGVTVDFTKYGAQNKVIAISTLFKIFKQGTEKDYTDILTIIKSAWGGMKESYSSEILKGVSLFHQVYKGEYDKASLIKRLAKVSPLAIVREAKVFIASGDRKYAVQIFNAYNNGTSRNRLPERL